jgi:CRP-like cAMP-binding protein
MLQSAQGSVAGGPATEAQAIKKITEADTLTRQPVLADAYALEEVTVIQIGRDHIEQLVAKRPLLLQEFGRLIEERHTRVQRAFASVDE